MKVEKRRKFHSFSQQSHIALTLCVDHTGSGAQRKTSWGRLSLQQVCGGEMVRVPELVESTNPREKLSRHLISFTRRLQQAKWWWNHISIKLYLTLASGFGAAQTYNFTNIRCARPPVGNLRFTAPVAPSERNLTIKDGSVGAICPHTATHWQAIGAEFADAWRGDLAYTYTFYKGLASTITSLEAPPRRDAGANCKFCDGCRPQAGRSNVSMPAYRHQQHFARYFNLMLSVRTERLLDPRRAWCQKALYY